MLKVFDKVVSEAPFLHHTRTIENQYKKHLLILYFVLFSSLFFFGYGVLKQLSIAYVTAYIIVWVYQFFNKTLFFNSLLWHISIISYVLILSPQTPIYANILGVIVLMIVGATVLSVQGKPIIAPILLGMLAGSTVVSIYMREPTFTLFYLVPMIQDANTMLGNSSFLTALIDANHFIAEIPERAFLYSNNASAYTDLIKNYTNTFVQNSDNLFYMIISPYSYNIGLGSIFVILLAYMMLSFNKIIDPVIPILYSFVFLLVYYVHLIGNPDAMNILKQGFVYNLSLWFFSVFIIANNIPINNKRGRYVATIITATIAAMMFYRSYYILNHIFAAIIMNISASLIEIICKKPVFGIIKPTIENFQNLKSRFKISRRYIIRISIGLLMITSVLISVSFLPNDAFKQREDLYFLNIVGDIFPDYRVQKTDFNKNVFQAEDTQGEISYIINSDSSLYRTYINILLLVKDNIIKEVRVVQLKTAHSYYIDIRLRQLLVGKDINNMTEILNDTEIETYSSKNPLVGHRIVDAFRKGSIIYSEFIKDKGI